MGIEFRLGRSDHKIVEDFLARRPGLRYSDVLCLLNLLAWVKRHHLALDESCRESCGVIK